jgi:hypothetical protein
MIILRLTRIRLENNDNSARNSDNSSKQFQFG